MEKPREETYGKVKAWKSTAELRKGMVWKSNVKEWRREEKQRKAMAGRGKDVTSKIKRSKGMVWNSRVM